MKHIKTFLESNSVDLDFNTSVTKIIDDVIHFDKNIELIRISYLDKENIDRILETKPLKRDISHHLKVINYMSDRK